MYDTVGKIYGAYELKQKTEIPNVNGTGYLFEHVKTKARVAVISNDDDNKVFNIGFRTPPKDDTGVPHITEHSVLCGSEKFPIKDPFVELVKGSLNTFLNAMTYPDKTVYPVASCNAQDFQNLMDVYLDAVFHPNIYKYDEIMKQEGWHYECESEDGPITYNGVVYNEMKGVFSSAESKLERVSLRSLFPDTPYFYESGGDPVAVPDLTQEMFEEFHSTYYHPSNSYIYLYGDMDVEEKLAFIDEEYLSKYDYLEVDSEIPAQEAPGKMLEISKSYAITDDEDEADKTYLSYNVVLGDRIDEETVEAMQMIAAVLLSAPGAPIKKALIDAGIGQDISSSIETSIRQPILSIVASNANANQKDEFVRIIREQLQKFVKEGVPKRSLEATLNRKEFSYKEASYGSYPKGLMYGLAMFDTWLYDDENVFSTLILEDVYASLRENLKTDYYEKVIQERWLNESHSSVVVLTPEKGLGEKEEQVLVDKLAAYKASLSKEELQKVIADTIALKEFQDREDKEEDIKKIPLLKISDIGKDARPIVNKEIEISGVKTIVHDIFTSGITYLKLSFNMRNLPVELIPVSSIFVSMLHQVDTKNYSCTDMMDEINFYTGGITESTIQFPIFDEKKDFGARFDVSGKALNQNVPKMLEFMQEVIFNSNLRDEKRLKEIVDEQLYGLHESLMSAGHQAMANRAKSRYNAGCKHKEMTDGMDYYNYLVDLKAHFEERKEQLMDQLDQVARCIFNKNGLIISVTTDADAKALLETPVVKFLEQVYPDYDAPNPEIALTEENEAYMTSSQVQYVACAGPFEGEPEDFDASLQVLRMIFAYEYLWMNVRVKGGAYGCSCSFARGGDGQFASYRDPNLENTYDVYAKAADYVESFDVDERSMTKYIIGTISGMDTPLTPSAMGSRSFAAYLQKVPFEWLQKDRDKVLATTAADIRALAPIVRQVTDYGVKMCLGNKDKIKEQAALFDQTIVFK